MSKDRFSELYSDYLLDQVDDSERLDFERHLESCSECQRELRELEETLFSIPLALPQSTPRPQLKDKILAQIGYASTDRIASPAAGLWKPWAIAASILAAFLAGVTVMQYRESLHYTRTISILERESEGLRSTNQGLITKISSLTQPNIVFVNLGGLENFEAVAASAFILAAEDSLNIFFHNLPELPPEQRYQLWLIESGQPPHPSVLFPPSGMVTEVVAPITIDAGNIATLAATIEPAQGSPQPTGPMVALGNVQ